MEAFHEIAHTAPHPRLLPDRAPRDGTIHIRGRQARQAADEVSLIERDGDSLKNGTLTGFYTGLFVDLMVWKSCPRHCGSGTATLALITTGLYTAIGTAIDAAIPGRTRIWPAKGTSALSHLALAIAPTRRTAFVGWKLR
jgi:hypothetical protein